jgi:hypothetical protein
MTHPSVAEHLRPTEHTRDAAQRIHAAFGGSNSAAASTSRSPRNHMAERESQSLTTEASPTGQRYINHARFGSTVHLFVRETKEADGDLGAPPYLYAGPMTYVSHTGERQMRILWRLAHELPADIFHAARVVSWLTAPGWERSAIAGTHARRQARWHRVAEGGARRDEPGHSTEPCLRRRRHVPAHRCK